MVLGAGGSLVSVNGGLRSVRTAMRVAMVALLVF